MFANVLIMPLFQWIGVDPWFGTGSLTVTTTGEDGMPTPAPVLVGFKVSKNAQGKIDVAVSDEIMGILDDIFAGIPPCPGAKLRTKRQSCPARLQAAADAFSAHPELQPAFEQLSSDLAAEMGGADYAAQLAAGNQALGFGVTGQAELEAIIDVLFSGAPLEALAGGAQAGVIAASVFAVYNTLWTGGQQLSNWYKFTAGTPAPYSVPSIEPSVTTQSTSSCPKPLPTETPVRSTFSRPADF
jgi:hypothetical protein